MSLTLDKFPLLQSWASAILSDINNISAQSYFVLIYLTANCIYQVKAFVAELSLLHLIIFWLMLQIWKHTIDNPVVNL